jgi:hypothetical protein
VACLHWSDHLQGWHQRSPQLQLQRASMWDPAVAGGIAPIVTYDTCTINPGQRQYYATKEQLVTTDKSAKFASSKIISPTIQKQYLRSKRCSRKPRTCRRRSKESLPRSGGHMPNRITQHTANCATLIGIHHNQ